MQLFLLKRAVLISGILLCHIGCTPQYPLSSHAPSSVPKPEHKQKQSDTLCTLPTKTVVNLTWTQGPIPPKTLEEKNLDTQFSAASEKLNLEQDAKHLEILQQEVKFQTTMRLERMRMHHRARLNRASNKTFTLPEVSFFIDNPFQPS